MGYRMYKKTKTIELNSWEDMEQKYPKWRKGLTIEEEKEFVNDCFNLYKKRGFSNAFISQCGVLKSLKVNDRLLIKKRGRHMTEEFTENNLLTNFPARQLELYRKAIKEYGDKTLYVSDEAYNNEGVSINEYYSLRTEVNCDRSDFWQLFNKLRKN